MHHAGLKMAEGSWMVGRVIPTILRPPNITIDVVDHINQLHPQSSIISSFYHFLNIYIYTHIHVHKHHDVSQGPCIDVETGASSTSMAPAISGGLHWVEVDGSTMKHRDLVNHEQSGIKTQHGNLGFPLQCFNEDLEHPLFE